METWLYVLLTLTFYFLIIVCAIFIDSVSIIFGFIGAISCTSISFTFPGLYFYISSKKWNAASTFKNSITIVFIVVGIILLVFLITANIIEIVTY